MYFITFGAIRAYKKGGGYIWGDENVWDLSRGGRCIIL